MGVKDELEKAVHNVKDAISEGMHRGAADAEQTKRDVDGDDMTLGDKARSVANQAKNTVQADIDSAKRTARENT